MVFGILVLVINIVLVFFSIFLLCLRLSSKLKTCLSIYLLPGPDNEINVRTNFFHSINRIIDQLPWRVARVISVASEAFARWRI